MTTSYGLAEVNGERDQSLCLWVICTHMMMNNSWSMGYGFVSYSLIIDAIIAISSMNG